MNRLITCLFITFFFVPSYGETPNSTSPALWENAFDLYREIDKSDENIIFSPYGATTLMALAYGGASGETADQIAKGFKFTDGAAIHESMSLLSNKINRMNQPGTLDLITKNSLWIQNGFPILPEFEDLVKKKYQAHVQNLDLQTNPETSTKQINGWISDQTQKFIQNVVREDQVKDSKLMAVNTIYMKGLWENPFEESFTREMVFYGDKKTKIKTPFMQKKQCLRYSENDSFQALQLPYQGSSRLSMLVVLPKEKKDFEVQEKLVSASMIQSLWSTLKSYSVQLYLPKFSFEKMIPLVKPSQKLGVENLFDPSKSDLSKISGKPELFVAEYFQKARIEIDEKGTKAAAATVMTMKVGAAPSLRPPEPKTFTADHPFLFYIIEPETQAILFMGRVMDPSKN